MHPDPTLLSIFTDDALHDELRRRGSGVMADEPGKLTPTLVADLKDKSRIRWCITPMEGEMMTADVVGGTLHSLDKLLKATMKGTGAPVTVLVESIATDDTGTITFTLLVLRYSQSAMRKKRMKRAATPPGQGAA